MLGFGTATRVYLAVGATDMRKGFDGPLTHALWRQKCDSALASLNSYTRFFPCLTSRVVFICRLIAFMADRGVSISVESPGIFRLFLRQSQVPS